ncbi:hypothetical protein UK23_11625 [Lentzea aerocolonigenes]|uniref:Uncharacterized protein n=1 Tax=Lentzea aerocolonigenes TaxID=68170 RepID=A0A0F0H5M0_LENAE|nr:hypothetical protein [Lentzea aerocolonigenes]KJK50161.1 hypothetical protein UK23_11625 [Lentzea aerocolonigenes]
MTESFARRAAGLLLIALTAALALIVAARLAAWAAAASAQPLGIGELAVGGVAFWAVTISGLWWHRRRMPMWRVWARWAAFPGVFIALVESVQLAVGHGKPLALAVAIGLAVVCWTLGEAVLLVTTRPVTAGLLASNLEIPFATRRLKARLCVRDDRLVLDSLVSRLKRSRDVIAVPWTTLRSIELIDVDQEMVCQVVVFTGLPQGTTREFDVTPGPALHVVGTARELLVPVTEEVGRAVLRAVEIRSAGVEIEEKALADDRWWRRSGVRKTDALSVAEGRSGAHHRTDYRPYKMALVGAFLLMPLVVLAGTVLSLAAGSAKWQKQFLVFGGTINPGWIATLGVASVGFLFLLHRFVIKPFFRFMEGQNFIEAFPEPPGPPKNTGTVPGSGKKRKKR